MFLTREFYEANESSSTCRLRFKQRVETSAPPFFEEAEKLHAWRSIATRNGACRWSWRHREHKVRGNEKAPCQSSLRFGLFNGLCAWTPSAALLRRNHHGGRSESKHPRRCAARRRDSAGSSLIWRLFKKRGDCDQTRPVPQRRCKKRSHGENRILSASNPMITMTNIIPIT